MARVPERDPRMAGRELQYRWEWRLKSSPQALWPLVADTNRFNRDAGIPPLERGVRSGRTAAGASGCRGSASPPSGKRNRSSGSSRTGSASGGATARGRSRRCPSTPSCGRSRAGDGARLPGRGAPAEPRRRARDPAADRAAEPAPLRADVPAVRRDRLRRRGGGQRCETGKPGPGRGPPGGRGTPGPPPRGSSRTAREPAGGARRVGRRHHGRQAASVRLRRPLGIRRRDVLELFLHATRAGLLELRWDLLCPLCRGANERSRSLREVEARAHCASCQIDFDLDFARSVELSFRPSAAIRDVPEREFCIGGPQVHPTLPPSSSSRPAASGRSS